VTPDWDKTGLERRILAAHARNDGAALAELYERGAAGWLRQGDTDAAAFYLTQAYVFALDAGTPGVDRLRSRLIAMGRESSA